MTTATLPRWNGTLPAKPLPAPKHPVLDAMTQRLAETQSPLAFVALWVAWVPVYAASTIASVLAPSDDVEHDGPAPSPWPVSWRRMLGKIAREKRAERRAVRH